MDDLDTRRERAALNQSLFREVNERITALSSRFADRPNGTTYVCECLNTECSATLELPSEKYEHLRQDGTRFFVLPGHEDPAVEAVVEETERYLIVEKKGIAADTAESMDPRKVGSA